MLVANTTEAQIAPLSDAAAASSQSANLIHSQVKGAAEAGLTQSIGLSSTELAANDAVAGSALIAPKAPGEIVDLTPEIARSAVDDALLAMDSYHESAAPEGYTRLSQDEINAAVGGSVKLNDENSGFAAAVYRNDATGDITIAFRGSEAGSWEEFQNDWLESDVGQAFFNVPESYKQGAELAGKIQAGFGDNAKVTLTGHSLGGGIANYAAIEHNMDYTVFNAAGLAQHTVNSLGDKVAQYSGHGTVINDQYDPLTNYGGKNNDETWGDNAKHIGYDELVFVDNDSFKNWWDVAFNLNKRVDAHNLKNVIPSLQQAAMMA